MNPAWIYLEIPFPITAHKKAGMFSHKTIVNASFDRMQMMHSVAVSGKVYVCAQSSNLGITCGLYQALIPSATQ